MHRESQQRQQTAPTKTTASRQVTLLLFSQHSLHLQPSFISQDNNNKDIMKNPRSPQDEVVSVRDPKRRKVELSKYKMTIASLRQQQYKQLNEYKKNAIEALDPEDPETGYRMVMMTSYMDNVARRTTDVLYPAPDFRCEVAGMGSNDGNLLGFESEIIQKEGSEDYHVQTDFEPLLIPGNPLPQKNIVQVAAGGSHTIVLVDDGTCYSWGVGDEGNLGRGNNLDGQGIIGKVNIKDIVQIAAGDTHTIFLDIQGRVWITGVFRHSEARNWNYANDPSELGKGKAIWSPILVEQLPETVKIAAGGDICVALTKKGKLFTWGLGVSGELARSKSMNAPTMMAPEPIPGLDNEDCPTYKTFNYDAPMMGEMVTDEEGHTGLKLDKKKLHKNFMVPREVDWADEEPAEILDFSVGKYHIAVVARKKGEFQTRVYTAGSNANGQLGLGHYKSKHELTEVKELSTKQIGGIACATYHCLAVGMTGEEVYAWGNATSGRLGLTDEEDTERTRTTPQKVAFPDYFPQDDRIVGVTAGDEISFAMTARGDLYSWGFNPYSQSGISVDTMETIFRPRKVDVMRSITPLNPGATRCRVLAVSAGAQHTMLLLKRYK